MNRIPTRQYKIVKDTKHNAVQPWYVIVKCTGFWQQVSPRYMYCSAAERFCKDRRITITEIVCIR